jgi:hypothetical protein
MKLLIIECSSPPLSSKYSPQHSVFKDPHPCSYPDTKDTNETTENKKFWESESQSHFTTDGQSVSPSWCRTPFGAHDHILITV